MGKRGQVTTYFIIGILFLVIIIGVVITRQNLLKSTFKKEIQEELTLPPHLLQVKTLIDSCIDSSSQDLLLILGSQGGYINLPSPYLETSLLSYSYAYYQGQNKLNSLTNMQNEFSQSLSLLVSSCADFSKFPALKIESKPINARTTIKDDSILLELYYPLTITKDSQTTQLNPKYTKTFQIRLGKIHSIAQEIVNRAIRDPDNIDLTYLLETGLDIDIYPYDDTTLVYQLTDKESSINNLPFVFTFANKF